MYAAAAEHFILKDAPDPPSPTQEAPREVDKETAQKLFESYNAAVCSTCVRGKMLQSSPESF